MKAPVDAARLLRASNPVPDDAFAGAAGDSLGRATFERIVGDSPQPAPATSRSPRRRLALRSAAGAAALAAGAVVLVAVMLPGAGHGGAGGQAVDTAYVLRQAGSALSAADSGEIAQMTVTQSVAAPSAATKTVLAPVEEWSYHGQWRLSVDSVDGKPALDMGFSTSSAYTVVNYQQRKWSRLRSLQPLVPAAPVPASGPGGCGKAAAGLTWLFDPGLSGTVRASPLPATVATALRAAISCGTLTVAGRQRVDGTEAIELTSRPGSRVLETVWVNPDTYLPVRVVVREPVGANVIMAGLQYIWREADIVWLPPTARNLARLTVPVPAGFRQVSPAMASPLLNVHLPHPR